MNPFLYDYDIEIFVKTENELETSIQMVEIYNQEIAMEIGIEKSYY